MHDTINLLITIDNSNSPNHCKSLEIELYNEYKMATKGKEYTSSKHIY